MAIRPHIIPHRPTKHLRQRHVRHLAHDVPQREVDARDGRRAHDAVPVPEVLPVHHLPEILHARRVLTDKEMRHVLDRAHHAARVPLQRRLTPADEPRLIRDHFHKHPVSHPGMADERFDGGDFHECRWDEVKRVKNSSNETVLAKGEPTNEPHRLHQCSNRENETSETTGAARFAF